jgi:putative Holliday junction resolvase
MSSPRVQVRPRVRRRRRDSGRAQSAREQAGTRREAPVDRAEGAAGSHDPSERRRAAPQADAPGGVWIGVDVGTVRVGVARSDPNGVLATPLATLARDPAANRDVAELSDLVREHAAVGVVVGLPRTLADREGSSALMARDYAASLAHAISPIPVRHVDERLSTVSAQRKLAQGSIRGRARRAVIDQVAAVELLQHWLDMRRS